MNKLVILALTLFALFLLQACGGPHGTGALMTRLDKDTCRDEVTGKMWRIPRSEPVTSLEEANAYIAGLNQQDAHKDWRLPTVFEIYDLHTLFDLHKNGDCAMELDGKYWSGEKDGEGMVGAWEISDQCDPERQYFPGGEGRVRPVRP